jgi:hypothetical protein
MAHTFTCKIGRDTVTVSRFIGDVVKVVYQGKTSIIRPTEDGWQRMTGDDDQKTVDKIGAAIEKVVGG